MTLAADPTAASHADSHNARFAWYLPLFVFAMFFFFGGITHEQAQRSLRLFANEVMPKLKKREPRIS